MIAIAGLVFICIRTISVSLSVVIDEVDRKNRL